MHMTGEFNRRKVEKTFILRSHKNHATNTLIEMKKTLVAVSLQMDSNHPPYVFFAIPERTVFSGKPATFLIRR